MSNLNTCLRAPKHPLGALGAGLENAASTGFEVKSPGGRPGNNDWTFLPLFFKMCNREENKS